MAFVSPALDIIFISIWGLAGAVVGMTIGQTLGGIIAIFFLLNALSRQGFSWRLLHFDWGVFRGLLLIGFTTLAVTLMWTLQTFLVRAQTINAVGLSGAGLFQAGWSLVYMVTSLTVSTLLYYTFPKISGSADDMAKTRIMNESLAFGILLLTAGTLALSVAREVVIGILFRTDFTAAGNLLPLLGIGAIFYISNWIIGTPLVPKGRLTAFFILNAIPTALFPILTALLLPRFGLSGVGLAYVGSNLLTTPIYLWDQFRSIGFIPSLNNSLVVMASALTLVAEVLIGDSSIWAIGLRVAFASGWTLVVLRCTQRYVRWDLVTKSVLLLKAKSRKYASADD